ncbi:MAG: reverse transcriptase domain-containing protein [Candidatus Daviesbacteria bacterium]|nr:reverse transcriptase domain-containing protein [Candidatus Daviesbacteria bacterium]
MLYSQLISIEHLLQAWEEFKVGKRNKSDVQNFERNLENSLFSLHRDLKERVYQHASYTAFNIYDPKFRHIHKARVRDRIVHHAVVSLIEPLFDKTFIYDSYSCRDNKGSHKAVTRLAIFIRKISKNYTGNCFVLKLDVKKFFANVNQTILFDCIKKRVEDPDLLCLIKNILGSFSNNTGIPIGNLTSQIFANIYLNELDQFVKHVLKEKYYIRYCDDFTIVSPTKRHLENLIPQIETFLNEKLRLSLHEGKIVIRKYTQGVDFLGYIIMPHVILPRTKTRRRVFKKLREKINNLQTGIVSEGSFNQSLQSYLGYLGHANSYKLTQKLKNQIWIWESKSNN